MKNVPNLVKLVPKSSLVCSPMDPDARSPTSAPKSSLVCSPMDPDACSLTLAQKSSLVCSKEGSVNAGIASGSQSDPPKLSGKIVTSPPDPDVMEASGSAVVNGSNRGPRVDPDARSPLTSAPHWPLATPFSTTDSDSVREEGIDFTSTDYASASENPAVSSDEKSPEYDAKGMRGGSIQEEVEEASRKYS